MWRKEREKSWSGTHYGLYTHLKRYFQVIDVDVSGDLKSEIIRKVRGTFKIDDMGLSGMKRREHIVKRELRDCNIPLIQFEECPYNWNGPHYIYQDLHVGYVKKLMEENPDIFKISGFQKFKRESVCKREQYQKTFYENVDGILTMGKWLEIELTDSYGIPKEKVFHVGGGVNIDVSKIDYSQKKGNKILFVGRDFERKNGPLVVEAFKLAKKKKSNLELYIAGPKKLSLSEEGITLLGDMSYEDLVNYFNLCDVFCMPSKFEAYGLVFVEALTFGLPCIGRDAYEMPYFIEDGKTGYLLKKDSAEELSSLMIAAINNSEMKMNVRNKRDFYKEEYSWDTVSRRIYYAITTGNTQ
jgi:glycosyltransferase involved in cell wall biosynthesis